MKFWKSLNNLIEETLPEWRDKFLSYKDLKKQLKRIYPLEEGESCRKRPRVEGQAAADEVDEFVRGLEKEVEKFNSFFVEKEEEYVIRWKVSHDAFDYLQFLSFRQFVAGLVLFL